ncbi:hypothetical protein WJR50_10585 [Catalinimonas sp. 4WD22]|uniref:hypothetical protein n=1 Tax=Catalinimonas locisalis TaxID=3133978 RepID=UPI00310103EF
MNNNSIDTERKSIPETSPNESIDQEKDKTIRFLFVSLMLAVLLVLSMLIYVVNEYLVVQNANAQFLNDHYNFGPDQPFYRESAEAYLNFVLRFIIIYGLISFFGFVSFILRRPWLYLLIIVMSVISVIYFFLL